jgi:peptidoglycan hydrolase-like protein with peptidoglycan-binding domain
MFFASTANLHANNLTTQIQIMLNELNFNAGSPDGIYGKKTNSALNSFYRKYNKNYDGNLSQNEFDDILSKMPKAFNNEDLIIKVSNNRHKIVL